MLRYQAGLMGAAALLAAALMYCGNAVTNASNDDTASQPPSGYVIDSVRPIELELERFRERLGPPPTQLTGGAASMDGLVRSFARAVEAGDTAALHRMQISAPEFAWLIYPESPYTRPPYRQAPQIVWLRIRMGDSGLRRLIERRAGKPLRIVSHRCDPEPGIEGDNRLWKRCVLRTVGAAGDTLDERLFGLVYERNGRFKFASYQNQY